MSNQNGVTAQATPSHTLGEAEAAAEHSLGLEPTQRLRRVVGRNLWTGNLIGACAAAALGIYVIISSSGFGYGTTSKPGAGVFPLAIGFVLVLLSLVWLVQCLAGRVSREEEPSDADRPGRLKVVLTVAVIIGFALLVNVLGYQLTMLLAMATILTFVARTKWWLTLVLSAGMAFGTFTLFDLGLGVLLPVSGIPFLEQLGL
ncbi:tripartite tricarboxylate transporter TctB family protein [Paenarthrobacter sp. NPDC089989]|uniref:tripartite tricarboxylate transporter TctB family protein n=1 Tax=unclassified Paenarthrobacter TaxID=2634190 RepID=UPI0038131700